MLFSHTYRVLTGLSVQWAVMFDPDANPGWEEDNWIQMRRVVGSYVVLILFGLFLTLQTWFTPTGAFVSKLRAPLTHRCTDVIKMLGALNHAMMEQDQCFTCWRISLDVPWYCRS